MKIVFTNQYHQPIRVRDDREIQPGELVSVPVGAIFAKIVIEEPEASGD